MDSVEDIFGFDHHGLPNPDELALDGGTTLGPAPVNSRHLDDFLLYDSVILLDTDVSKTASYRREVTVELRYNDNDTTDVMLTERILPFAKPQGSKPRRLIETIVYNGKKYMIAVEPSLERLFEKLGIRERRLFVTLPSPETRDCRYDGDDEPNSWIKADMEFAREASEKLFGQYRTVYREQMDYTLLEEMIITRLAKNASVSDLKEP